MNEALSIVAALVSMIGFGLSDFVAKTAVAKTSPFRTLLFSQLVGTLPYLVMVLAYDRAVPDQSLIFLTMLSASLFTIMLYSFYLALRLGKASIVSPVSSCLTVVAVVLSVTILRETLTGSQIFLIASVTLGILLVALQSPDTRSTASNRSVLLSLLVVFLGGGNAILVKWIASTGHYLVGFLFIRFFMLGFLIVLFPIFGRETHVTLARPNEKSGSAYPRIALLGLIDVSAFFAAFIALREGFVSIVIPISNSSAAVTILLAHIFLKERLLVHQRIGIATILVCVVLLSVIYQW